MTCGFNHEVLPPDYRWQCCIKLCPGVLGSLGFVIHTPKWLTYSFTDHLQAFNDLYKWGPSFGSVCRLSGRLSSTSKRYPSSNQTSLMAPQKASLQLSGSCKNNHSVSFPSNVPWLSLVTLVWSTKSNADIPKDRGIKTEEQMAFSASALNSQPSATPTTTTTLMLHFFFFNNNWVYTTRKRAVKSALNFSTSLYVKLWDNCHDLINKRRWK